MVSSANHSCRASKRLSWSSRLDLADRHLPMGFGQLPHDVRCDHGPGPLAPRWATGTTAVQPVPSTIALTIAELKPHDIQSRRFQGKVGPLGMEFEEASCRVEKLPK